MRMRKHIDGLKSLEIPSSLDEEIKISRESHRITRDIDQLKFMIFLQINKKFTYIFV